MSIIRKIYRLVKFPIKFPFVALKAIIKDEIHIIRFYFDIHIVRALGLYKWPNNELRQVANDVDNSALKVIGIDHEIYSAGTAAEVASGFDLCVDHIMQKKTNISYLEIGSAKGKSMGMVGHLVSLRGASFKGISIDPYFDEAYCEGADQPERFLQGAGVYTAPIDISSREEAIALWDSLGLNVEQIRQTSKIALDNLCKREEKFDLVYIDGLHDGLTPILDFIGVLKLIDNESMVILDDRHWANVHHLRKICDNSPGMKKVFENWQISIYLILDREVLLG